MTKLAFNLNFYFQFGIEIKILYHDIRSKLAIKMGENAKNAGSAKKKKKKKTIKFGNIRKEKDI